MKAFRELYLFEHRVEHGLVVVEGDGADEGAAELVNVAQRHGREVHVQQGRPVNSRDRSDASSQAMRCVKLGIPNGLVFVEFFTTRDHP